MRENKQKTTLWLRPDTIGKMDQWMDAANSRSRSEFAEQALEFYVGYLETNDTARFLPEVITDTLSGIMEDNDLKVHALLFRLCVEVNMACHTIAAHFRVDEETRSQLRRFAVEEVKRTNGKISFEHAAKVQAR